MTSSRRMSSSDSPGSSMNSKRNRGAGIGTRVWGRAGSQTWRQRVGRPGTSPVSSRSTTSHDSSKPVSCNAEPIRPRVADRAPSHPTTNRARMDEPSARPTSTPSSSWVIATTSTPARTSAPASTTASRRIASKVGWWKKTEDGQPVAAIGGTVVDSRVRRSAVRNAIPSLRTDPSSTRSAQPSSWRTRRASWSHCTARGSGNGSVSRSTTTTDRPRRAQRPASAAPVGPNPTTTRSTGSAASLTTASVPNRPAGRRGRPARGTRAGGWVPTSWPRARR